MKCVACALLFVLLVNSVFCFSIRNHEYHGNNSCRYISNLSHLICGIIGHSGQRCPHLLPGSKMQVEREMCQTSHTLTGNISLQLVITVRQTWRTSAAGGEKLRLFFIFQFFSSRRHDFVDQYQTLCCSWQSSNYSELIMNMCWRAAVSVLSHFQLLTLFTDGFFAALNSVSFAG